MSELREFSEDELLPLSAISDVVFCERRAALHVVERIWEENVHTAEGAITHERVHGAEGTEVRKNVRIARGLLMRSLQLGLSGKADVVEFHKIEGLPGQAGGPQRALTGISLEGAKGLWLPYPIEYKAGRLRSNRSFEVQLCAQAMCLEEMLGVDVLQGAIFFGKTGKRLDVMIDQSLRSDTKAAAARLHEIAASSATPTAKFENKCGKCSLLDVCAPKIMEGSRKVKSYLKRAIAETTEVDL
jgi:CRISPR-associated exonuclease Cas4